MKPEENIDDELIKEEVHTDEPPPILGSWRNLYFVVIGTLVLLIVLFYLFTISYS